MQQTSMPTTETASKANSSRSSSADADNNAHRVLFLAPEWGSITKIGGLADVVASLSKALIASGSEVRTVLLGYPHMQMQLHKRHFHPQLPFFILEESSHPEYPGNIFYIIRHPALDTVYEPYSPSYSNSDFALDFLQAILLALAPFAISENPEVNWSPELVHSHDWPCALYPYLNQHLHELFPQFTAKQIPCLLTIHNAAYVGSFGAEIEKSFRMLLNQWGISIAESFKLEAWKFSGKINLLATGIRYAEKINTVSPTHAQELLEENGGISELLRERRDDFSGILNGVDDYSWSPQSDPYLKEHTYQAKPQEVKKAKLYWRKYLQEALQFEINPKLPLFISICRIVKQKGLDDLFNLHGTQPPSGPMLNALAEQRCQLIILGEGEKELEVQLQLLSWQHSQSFIFLNYFYEEMAHLLTAAADFFIMPSRYEPCGLNQIYSQNYGTIPIVRKTGGLADTVQHELSGLVFQDCTELQTTLERAFHLWGRKHRQFWEMQKYAMEMDFSWQKNLDEYIQLYHEVKNANK